MPMRFCISFFFFLVSNFLVASNYPKKAFVSPIDAPLILSGNFGELRPNHFHAGIDITTNGKEGVAVFAAASGYVSRIRISPYGYGKAIYITHPNGFTTVYGHLRNFNTTIEAYVLKQQYADEQFEVDILLQPAELPVKQAEVIAYSGNSGSSGGPHLHFEIRDTETEEAINPLLFGLPLIDNVRPTLVRIAIYPLDNNSCVNGKHSKLIIPLSNNKGVYIPAKEQPLPQVHGRIGFAIEAYDQESKPNGKNGVYSIELNIDQQTIYKHHLERIPFDKSRYINCFIDYAEYQKSKRYLQCSFLPPNNELPVYDTLINRGEMIFNDKSVHNLVYRVHDVFGNESKAVFTVKGSTTECPQLLSPLPFIQLIPWDTLSVFEEPGIWQITFPAQAVYDRIPLSIVYDTSAAKMPVLSFGNKDMALHKACTLHYFYNIPEQLRTKAVLVEQETSGKKLIQKAVGGRWENGALIVEIKNFGKYTLAYDTIAPKIRPSNFDLKKEQTNLSALNALNFIVSDNLSGIAAHRALLDGKWILLEYDAKNNLFTHRFTDQASGARHELQIEVTDKCGNKKTYTKIFTR